MDRLVDDTTAEHANTIPLDEGVDPLAQTHRDAIRRGADSNE